MPITSTPCGAIRVVTSPMTRWPAIAPSTITEGLTGGPAVADEPTHVRRRKGNPLDDVDHRSIWVGDHEVVLAELGGEVDQEVATHLTRHRIHRLDVVHLEGEQHTLRSVRRNFGDRFVAALDERDQCS